MHPTTRLAPTETTPADEASSDERSDSRHGPIAQLLIAWSPLSVILIAYALAGWISGPLGTGDGADVNRLGFRVHVSGPADVDRMLFGTIPSAWLQDRLVDGSPHWYDAVAAIVYATHFISIPILTAIAWFWLRERFAAWITSVLVFTTLGVGVYVMYPAAPPWLASDQDQIGSVARISDPGWDYLHLEWLGQLTTSGQDGSNPVAAMPSLHAGAALLVVLFLWPIVSTWWRGLLLAYAMAMALTLVYCGEHYVVDVIAGWLVAIIAIAAGTAVRRLKGRREPSNVTAASTRKIASAVPLSSSTTRHVAPERMTVLNKGVKDLTLPRPARRPQP